MTRGLVGLLLGLALSGCAPAPDADQLRLCRLALVALVEPGTALTVTSQSLVAAGREGVGVRVSAQLEPLGRTQDVFVECRFAANGAPGNLDSLVAVRTGAGTLSEPRLFFLKRFWLALPDADRADPQPIALWRGAPNLPLGLAHGVQNALAALPGVAVYGLLAAAYSLVYGLVGRINLAFGAMAAVGGAASLSALGFVTHPTLAVMIAVAIPAALWAGLLHGAVVARLVFLPLSRATGQQSLVATIGLALVLGEYLRLAQGSAPLWVVPLRATPIGIARNGDYVVTVTPLALVVAVGFTLAAAAILVVMARTQFGRNWRAMADDPTASALLGVDPVRVFGLTFASASALAGAAGAVTVLVYGSFGTTFGTILGLKALLAAILGGIGSVPGAFFGGLVIALFEVIWSAVFPIEYRDLALFVALSAVLVARPGGLLGFRELGPRRV